MTAPRMASDQHQRAIPCLLPKSTENLDYTGTAAASAALAVGVIRLCASTDCYVLIGAVVNDTDPVADAEDMLLPAGVVEYFRVEAGWKVSAIQKSSAGELSITQMG